MMRLILSYFDQGNQALREGADIEDLVKLPVREAIGRFKYTEEADLDRAFAEIQKILADQIRQAVSRKEDY